MLLQINWSSAVCILSGLTVSPTACTLSLSRTILLHLGFSRVFPGHRSYLLILYEIWLLVYKCLWKRYLVWGRVGIGLDCWACYLCKLDLCFWKALRPKLRFALMWWSSTSLLSRLVKCDLGIIVKTKSQMLDPNNRCTSSQSNRHWRYRCSLQFRSKILLNG